MIHREFYLLSDCTIWANIGIGPFIKDCTKLLTNSKNVYNNSQTPSKSSVGDFSILLFALMKSFDFGSDRVAMSTKGC